jgi:hypothetical protein
MAAQKSHPVSERGWRDLLQIRSLLDRQPLRVILMPPFSIEGKKTLGKRNAQMRLFSHATKPTLPVDHRLEKGLDDFSYATAAPGTVWLAAIFGLLSFQFEWNHTSSNAVSGLTVETDFRSRLLCNSGAHVLPAVVINSRSCGFYSSSVWSHRWQAARV